MSEILLMGEAGKSRTTALLAMLKYVRDELGSIDPISQFCVDMAIHQLADRDRSTAMRFDAREGETTIQ
jgi:hypothetical protein